MIRCYGNCIFKTRLVFGNHFCHFRKLKEKPRFFPTASYEDNSELPEEEYCETVHKFTDPSIVYEAEVAKKK